MTNKYRGFLLYTILISGCGGLGESDLSTPDQPWTGGLVGIWEPAGKPRGAFILHQGHAAFSAPGYPPASLVPFAENLRDAGFVVYGFEMPTGEHGPPIERFYQPVLDLIDSIPADVPIYMAGLSGGGWTTSVVTALSPRIVRGYSVAGDAPLDVWSGGRDWEQLQVDYWGLYATAGDRLMHVYNSSDPCCFTGISGDIGYPYVLADNHDHSISEWTASYIIADATH